MALVHDHLVRPRPVLREGVKPVIRTDAMCKARLSNRANACLLCILDILPAEKRVSALLAIVSQLLVSYKPLAKIICAADTRWYLCTCW